ncbi:MAG: hypothetical protein AB7T31_13460 [Gemmatimonadales bacterium]
MLENLDGLGADASARIDSRLEAHELETQYAEYRKRQARALVGLLPREAVRPLYRRAIAAGYGERAATDPLATLVAFCETLLPLPPFELWCEDRAAFPSAHLHELDDSAAAPTEDAPTTVEARAFDLDGVPWVAYLRSFRDGTAWRGFIAFEESRSRLVHRTALIFRENDPADLRDRFLDFEPAALGAFLRSALP